MKSSVPVLLVEDNEDDLFLSLRVLEKVGIAPAHVSNGKDAMDYLAGRGVYHDRTLYPLPDVVLLDLKMPAYTGHEVLEWLRDQSQLRDMKVYILTSSDDPRDRQRAEKAGAQGYFLKPLLPAHLCTIFEESGSKDGNSTGQSSIEAKA
jgi:CheY-like chemotaxis protein